MHFMKNALFGLITLVAFTQGQTVLDSLSVESKRDEELKVYKESPFTVTVIDAKELDGRNVSVSEILDRVAGVKVRNTGGLGSGQTVSIRGLEGKRVKVFIDGAPVSAVEGSLGIDDLPVQIIDRIEIYKGVVPAHLGADALGGAINVVTRVRDYSYMDFTYKPSSFNTHTAMLLSKKYWGESGFYTGLGLIGNYSDNSYDMDLRGILERSDSRYTKVERDHDQYIQGLIGVVLGYEGGYFDDVKSEFVMIRNEKEIQGVNVPIGWAKTQSTMFVIAPEMEKAGFLLPNLTLDLDLGLVYTISRNIDTSTYIYGDWFTEPYQNVYRGETDDNSKHHSHDTLMGGQVRANLAYALHENHVININNMSQYMDYAPYDAYRRSEASVTASAYPAQMFSDVAAASHEWTLFDARLLNQLTGKYYGQLVQVDLSENRALDHVVMGKVSNSYHSTHSFGFSEALRYTLLPGLHAKTSYERSVRLPEKEELFGNGRTINHSLELKPEQSHNVNLGVNWTSRRKRTFFPRIDIEANTFFRNTDKMIHLEDVAVGAQYLNIDEVNTVGAELDTKFDVLSWLYIAANVTWQDLTTEKNDRTPYKEGKRVSNVPWLFANSTVELTKQKLLGEKNTGKLFFETGFTESFYSSVQVLESPNDKVPRSFTHNAGVQYTLAGNYDIGFEIHNLSDEALYDEYHQPLPGRSWHLTFHAFFGDPRSRK